MDRIWYNVDFWVGYSGMEFNFPSFRIVAFAENPSLLYFLTEAGDRRGGFMPFPKVLARSKTQPLPGFELRSTISFLWR